MHGTVLCVNCVWLDGIDECTNMKVQRERKQLGGGFGCYSHTLTGADAKTQRSNTHSLGKAQDNGLNDTSGESDKVTRISIFLSMADGCWKE